MASNELGRFKIVRDRRELLLPACSAFNRADNEEYFIDTDLDFDGGRLYIGKSDAEDIARTINFVPMTEVTEIKNQLRELKIEHANLLNAVSSFKQHLPSICAALGLEVDPAQTVSANPVVPKPNKDAGTKRVKPSELTFELDDFFESPSGKDFD